MDYIGPYTFRSLQGSPPALMQQVLVLARPGVRGAAFWKQGVRGQQFTLRSLAGVASVGYGRWLYSEYCTLTDDDPVEMSWYGCALWAMEWIKVQVLEVQLVSLQQVLLDTAGSGALLECDWRLHTVEIIPD